MFNQISQLQPNLKTTNFHNLDQISQSQPHLTISTKSCKKFTILTKYNLFNQLSEFSNISECSPNFDQNSQFQPNYTLSATFLLQYNADNANNKDNTDNLDKYLSTKNFSFNKAYLCPISPVSQFL